MSESKEIHVGKLSFFEGLPLDFGNVTFGQLDKISPTLNDIILPSDVFVSNLAVAPLPKCPNWTAFLNFCLLVECLILNQNIITAATLIFTMLSKTSVGIASCF